MGRKPTGKPTGRPPIPIDESQFKKLCALHCTKEEFAGFFDCSEDTIDRWCKNTFGESFAVVFKRFSAGGKISLRRYQFKLAEKNPGMAIFLGKNWLGQTDKIEQTVMEVEDLSPLAAMLRDDVTLQATNTDLDTDEKNTDD